MKTITVTSNYLSSVFKQLHEQLGGELQIKSKEFRLEIDNHIGKGFISGITVEPAIGYIEYEIDLKEDITLKYNHSNSNSIHFGYCSKGFMTQRFEEKGEEKMLNQFQTGIFSNSSNKSTYFSFKKEQDIKVSMITVDTFSVYDKELKEELIATFISNKEENERAYIGSLNLNISEKIDKLNAIKQKGLVRNLLINSTVYLILALEIEQNKHDTIKAENGSALLTQADLLVVKTASEYITTNPEIQYSLKYLCSKFGISPFKLQEGFKILHNRTVTDFIRNVRVEVAENLIRTSELNISEIVYTVGLTSRSYFSKIFKEKYNCSPKHYQSHQNKLAATA